MINLGFFPYTPGFYDRSGKTIPGSIACMEGLVCAGLELAEILCQRFKQPKIYLVGHSFGTAIGARMAQRRPDLFAAYIGCNQEVNGAEAEPHAYEWTLAEARRRGDQKVIRALEGIGAPVRGTYRTPEGTTALPFGPGRYCLGAHHQPAPGILAQSHGRPLPGRMETARPTRPGLNGRIGTCATTG